MEFALGVALGLVVSWLMFVLSGVGREILFAEQLDYLRRGEGESVTLLCENTGADVVCQLHACEVLGAWTGWVPKRYYGGTIYSAVRGAARERGLYDEQKEEAAMQDAMGPQQ